MIESLFKGKSQKTTCEHETERSDGQLPILISKWNGLLRYQLKRYADLTHRVSGINRVEPRESNSRPVCGREFFC